MKSNDKVLQKIKDQLIVSCQALEDEPLHSPFIMGRMARAAFEGGASGIRANSIVDIEEIKKVVDLPVIGIIKAVYEDSKVFITPTIKEVDMLHHEGVEIIAMDATTRVRPDGTTIQELFPVIREKYPDQLFMADCSTYKDAKVAYELGFDLLGTTLSGYTDETAGVALPNFELLEQMVEDFPVPVVAEGGIWSPDELAKVFRIGVYTAVVGSAITRPQLITERFTQALQKETL